MEMNEYQEYAQETAIYPGRHSLTQEGFLYTTLGLAGEAGEFANKVKKSLRDGPQETETYVSELGDALWYIAMAADELDYTLEEVAQMNVAKLRKRKKENHLQGSGDDR